MESLYKKETPIAKFLRAAFCVEQKVAASGTRKRNSKARRTDIIHENKFLNPVSVIGAILNLNKRKEKNIG